MNEEQIHILNAERAKGEGLKNGFKEDAKQSEILILEKTERGREEQSFLDVSDCVQWRLKHPCWRRQSGPSFGSLLGHHSSEM